MTTLSDSNIAIDTEVTLTHDFGHIRLQGNTSSYVESDHWRAILDEIDDLKDMARGEADSIHETTNDGVQTLPGADLFFLHTYPATKTEIIAALPSRPLLDSIIARYFQTADMPVTLIIHRKVFFKQYENFWEDPHSTPIMWLTILLGNYMKGTPHTIEALLTFLQTEYVLGEDAQQGTWQLIGTIICVALKMGYHRDGSHFPDVSPFEAEMRRRTWYILIQFDIASASQLGLPRTIKESQCDTQEPRNLLDDDFDYTCSMLPPAIPPNEHTLSQFLIYKSRVVMVYGMICDFTTSSKQRDYGEAGRLDNLLRDSYTQKPAVLELKPLHRSIMDGTDLVTRRLYIAMSFYLAQMTLHRKFMFLAKTNSKYSASHATCIEAALLALGLQAELAEHTQPGRMLYADRWKIFVLIQSEFLLATIILCYNLDDNLTNSRQGKAPIATQEFTQKSLIALQVAQDIWWKQQDLSKEAGSAVKAIDVVLNKARGATVMPKRNVMSSWASSTVSSAGAAHFTEGNAGIVSSSSPLSEPMLQSFPKSNAPQSLHRRVPSKDSLSSTHFNYDDVSWNDFFDLDRSWESWLQF
ncbi:hypothetical protein BU23DRAFT_604894 [Bimuria novae-zelandiae CBS 107.79]|uniref:Xylanolytic transcriptional activator regulatory domain-containing protein n=1 Tax=Bimuria novae-zelandiae CBS 107.79 TaxID=1447943 RepID=A0A6A5UGF4_9PLEO|nr:hypothetical protein BU23DRAFT_604894 [Bimuria novae-zelandiae CBS 107.79]